MSSGKVGPMGKKVTLENLGAEVEKILKKYEGEVEENLDIVTRKIGQKGAQALRNESLNAFPDSKRHKKRYGATWTSRVEKTRLTTKVVIYNSQAGLPHLLENGHALVAGGRKAGFVEGRTHIEPIEKKLVEEYQQEVINRL